jgi:hypothetical protein
MQTKAIKTFCPAKFSVEIVTPMMATKYSQTHMPRAPTNSNLLRPNLSTPHMPGRVMNTLMTLVAMVIKKGLEIPEFLKNTVP